VEYLNKGVIITDDVLPFIYNGIESGVDIDEEDDIIFAEYVYNRLKLKFESVG
jgi:hypothetical protein